MSADQPVTLTDQEREALVEALRFDRCEYGCAITYTEEAVKFDLDPAVVKIVVAREAAAFERGRQALAKETFGPVAQLLEALTRTLSDARAGAGDVAVEHAQHLLADLRRAVLPVVVDAHSSSEQEDDRG